jgi:intracellular sulfur oxidation DsrE/DsrF family protein
MNRVIFILLIATNLAFSQKKFPQIDTYGGVFPVPEAELVPDPNQKYKIMFDILEAEKEQEKNQNHQFDLVARVINLYGEAGVKKENLDLIVVLHYEATPTILSDDSFMQVYKTKNPNTDIINKLGESGVKFYVCGQSLRARKFVDLERNKNIKVAHGALEALSYFQNKGYAILKLQ